MWRFRPVAAISKPQAPIPMLMRLAWRSQRVANTERQHSEDNVQVTLPLSVKGRQRFYALHESGKIITGRGDVPIYRDPSGYIRRCGLWEPNLITDVGMQNIGSYDWIRGAYNDVGILRDRLLLGDGSGTPAFTDTGLFNQTAESTSNGGFDDEETETVTDDGTTLTAKGVAVRVYTALTAMNFTEYGFTHVSAGQADIHEMLKNGGSPTTVSVPAGKKLRIDHEASLAAPLQTVVTFQVPEYDASDQLVDTVTYNGTLYVCGQRTWNFMEEGLEPAAVHKFAINDRTTAPALGSSVDLGANYVDGDASLEAPTGTEREKMLTVGEPDGNGFSIHSFAWGYVQSGNLFGGVMLVLSDGPVPKDNIHTLSGWLKLAWSRG